MKTLEIGKEKIKKICDALRDETLEPAQKEAQRIIEQAQQEASRMMAEAQKEVEKLRLESKLLIEREQKAFQSSLQQAARQGLETLRQGVEHMFFNEHLPVLIEKEMEDPSLAADLVRAIVNALQEEGLAADLMVLIPEKISVREVNELLLQDVLKNLNNHSVAIGDFNAGVQLKIKDRNLTIDISEEALKELLGTNMFRKDFRKLIFQQS